ncbi:MAG: hypothetical protein FJ045_02045 [Crenarchaeota archaeon]|nr:hypothetical protein [Thermoproteota archaeon]
MKRVRVSYGKLSLEISAVDVKNIDLKVFLDDQEFTVRFSAESLLEFLDRLRFAAESVVSELDI